MNDKRSAYQIILWKYFTCILMSFAVVIFCLSRAYEYILIVSSISLIGNVIVLLWFLGGMRQMQERDRTSTLDTPKADLGQDWVKARDFWYAVRAVESKTNLQPEYKRSDDSESMVWTFAYVGLSVDLTVHHTDSTRWLLLTVAVEEGAVWSVDMRMLLQDMFLALGESTLSTGRDLVIINSTGGVLYVNNRSAITVGKMLDHVYPER